MLVHRKQLTVGTIGGDYQLFNRQPGPREIEDAIYSKVCQRDILAYISKLKI